MDQEIIGFVRTIFGFANCTCCTFPECTPEAEKYTPTGAHNLDYYGCKNLWNKKPEISYNTYPSFPDPETANRILQGFKIASRVNCPVFNYLKKHNGSIIKCGEPFYIVEEYEKGVCTGVAYGKPTKRRIVKILYYDGRKFRKVEKLPKNLKKIYSFKEQGVGDSCACEGTGLRFGDCTIPVTIITILTEK